MIEMDEAVAAPIGEPGPESSEVPAASVGGLGLEAPVIEGSNATDLNDTDFVYDCTRLCKYKAYRRFKNDYNGCRVIVEGGLVVTDFDERPPCIQIVLKAQG